MTTTIGDDARASVGREQSPGARDALQNDLRMRAALSHSRSRLAGQKVSRSIRPPLATATLIFEGLDPGALVL